MSDDPSELKDGEILTNHSWEYLEQLELIELQKIFARWWIYYTSQATHGEIATALLRLPEINEIIERGVFEYYAESKDKGE